MKHQSSSQSHDHPYGTNDSSSQPPEHNSAPSRSPFWASFCKNSSSDAGHEHGLACGLRGGGQGRVVTRADIMHRIKGGVIGPLPTLLAVCLVLLLREARAKEQQPQVWDGGKWNDYDEDPLPGEPLPYPPTSDSWRSDDATILVSISSFRDHRCAKTLFNLFTKAAKPDRVSVGVVQQNEKDDSDCLYDYCVMMKEHQGIEPAVVVGQDKPAAILDRCPYADQVRIMRVMASEAKGPTYGRYLGSKLLGTEEFCMQTDAHMDFLFEWDTLLLHMWGLVRNEYAVLTTYVPRLEEMGINANERWEVPHICRTFFTPGDRMVRNEQAKAAIWLTRPKMTSTWAAGFAFNKCHADRRVPYDPHLPSVFDGEEYSKFARLWTRGYDTYTPHRSIVYHDYNHGPSTVVAGSWARKQKELARSTDRLKTLLGMPDATVPRNSSAAHELLGAWDLGNRRTLQQLIDFTGVDTTKYEVTKSSCGKLAWVPFDKDDKDINDDVSDPSVTAYDIYRRWQAADEQKRRPAADPLAPPSPAVGQGKSGGGGESRQLKGRVESADPQPTAQEVLHRALVSLGLSFLALTLLVAWWWEEKRVPP